MGARVYIEVRDNPDAEIVALGDRPKRFWLKSRALPGAKSAPAVSAPAVAPGKPAVQKSKLEWLEADLHPVLAHFARHTMGGVRVWTIPHQTSAKAQFGEWVHPDIVGVRFPKAMLGESATRELARAIGASPIRIVSFELEREVKFGNLREAFFLCLSGQATGPSVHRLQSPGHWLVVGGMGAKPPGAWAAQSGLRVEREARTVGFASHHWGPGGRPPGVDPERAGMNRSAGAKSRRSYGRGEAVVA